jgi:hypothetical protein
LNVVCSFPSLLVMLLKSAAFRGGGTTTLDEKKMGQLATMSALTLLFPGASSVK